MPWEQLAHTAVSILIPFIPQLINGAITISNAVTKEMADDVQSIWRLVSQTINTNKDDRIADIWDQFLEAPTKHVVELSDLLGRLMKPVATKVEEPVTSILQHKFSQCTKQQWFRLLDDESLFVLNDVIRIAGRIKADFVNQTGTNPNRVDLVQFLTPYVEVHQLGPELLAAMIEVRPDIILREC